MSRLSSIGKGNWIISVREFLLGRESFARLGWSEPHLQLTKCTIIYEGTDLDVCHCSVNALSYVRGSLARYADSSSVNTDHLSEVEVFDFDCKQLCLRDSRGISG